MHISWKESSDLIAMDDLKAALTSHFAAEPAADRAAFLARCDRFGQDAIDLLRLLYGEREDFNTQAEAIFKTAADAFASRRRALKTLDRQREADPAWYQDHRLVGAVCYVDRFAGTLAGLKEKIPYLKELGVNYLHLMPLYRTPDGPNDGGYAVSSYREVSPHLGEMKDLVALADSLHEEGIALVLDFVFNHTADDHEWALKALAGDKDHQEYYFFFDDRSLPDAYDRTLREIFPDEHPGAFTYREDVKKWVWTTFHSYQWDLNYRNPAVFREMLAELLSLANAGADVIRLDAVVFIWKKLGTTCENLPETHLIIQALNAFVRMAAPATVFKSEAIVHPDDVVQFFGTGRMSGRECELSYNPLLMVELWEALATGFTHLLTASMRARFSAPPANCAWVNYVRCHDDIGWGFADEDAWALHIDGFNHRQFLNRFYTGVEPGSFAAGHPFQFNPRNMDMRISGTAASLAGLEKALEQGNPLLVELALRRILLIHSIIFGMGGIPLIYLGDEIGQLNDRAYRDDPAHAGDSRWVHRGKMDWERSADRHDPETPAGRIFTTLARLSAIRKEHPAFGARAQTTLPDIRNPHLYACEKRAPGDRVILLGNFTGERQQFDAWTLPDYRPGRRCCDLISGREWDGGDWSLGPYEFLWLHWPDE